MSDPEDELTDSQKTSKLSEIYSTTIPSVDSAMESWDGSGIDAGYGSQGEFVSYGCVSQAKYKVNCLSLASNSRRV